MEVDFNNLRVQLAKNVSRLNKILNSRIDPNDGDIPLGVEDIDSIMLDITRLVSVLCCCYEKDNDDLKDVSEEAGRVEPFNFDEYENEQIYITR